MRTSTATLAAVLMLAGSSVFAQQAPATPVRTEGPFSPFTYERLGATPSIRLPGRAAAAEAKAPVKESAAATQAQDKAKVAAQAGAPTAQVSAPAAAATTH
jgi:hypothetical protein